jgi:uncharacterized protein YlxW (UPF0749 family)
MPEAPPTRPPERPADGSRERLPEHVTLPLLTLLTQQSLDEDYQHVAERRRAGSPLPARARSHRTAAIVVAAFALLVTVAALQTSRNAGITDASRATLVHQITANRARVADLQDRIVRQRERNVGLQSRLSRLNDTVRAAEARQRRLEVSTGFVAVTGPGVRIAVDDAPNGDPTQAVRDEDLALLVDGLWSAGAEAIAINGQRLTALTAIRNSGPAVHVNGRPLAPPYTVLAIGDTRTLQADLLDSTHGSEFYNLAHQLQFVYEMHNEDAMSLPAAPDRLLQLRHAVAGTAADQNDHVEGGSTP